MFKIWVWSGPYDYLGFFMKVNKYEHMRFRSRVEADIFAKNNINGNYLIVQWGV